MKNQENHVKFSKFIKKCVENFSRKSIPHIEIYYLHNKFMCGKLKYDIA